MMVSMKKEGRYQSRISSAFMVTCLTFVLLIGFELVLTSDTYTNADTNANTVIVTDKEITNTENKIIMRMKNRDHRILSTITKQHNGPSQQILHTDEKDRNLNSLTFQNERFPPNVFFNQAQEAASIVQNVNKRIGQSSPVNEMDNTPTITTSFKLAYDESFGFFDDITDEAWKLKKEISKKQPHNGEPHPLEKIRGFIPKYYYMNNWHPEFTCNFERAVGNVGDGHKWVCDPHRLAKLDDCLVYSVGSLGDFSFEEALQEIAPNCEIHIFDILDFSTQMPPGLKANFHARGLQSKRESQLQPNQRVFWSLEGIMKKLGHTGRRIDVFKIDCEDCEWETYEDMLQQDLRQILVEVHKLKKPEMFDVLHKAGYAIFHKEPNTFTDGNVVEYSFMRLKKSFFGAESASSP